MKQRATSSSRNKIIFGSKQHQRGLLQKSIRSWYDPEQVLTETQDDLGLLLSDSSQQSYDAMKRLEPREDGLCGPVFLDDHNLLAETVGERYRTATVEYARRLEVELGECTVTEKTIIEAAAIAYGRHLSCAARMEETLQLGAAEVRSERARIVSLVSNWYSKD